MKKTSKFAWFRDRSLENRFAIIAILLTQLYLITNIFIDIGIAHINLITAVFGTLILLCSFGLYLLLIQKFQRVVTTLFSLSVFTALVFLLPLTSGPSGGISYSFQALSVILILLSQGRIRTVFSLALVTMVIMIRSDLINYVGSIEPISLHIDFLLNFLFIGIIMYLFKRNLDKDTMKLMAKNDELEDLNSKLEIQGKELERTNRKIDKIRNNLHKEVVKRTKKLENENKRLLDYSFINAHLVRAPLANLLAITELNADNPKLEELKEGIEEMDRIIHKIAGVLAIKGSTK